MSNLESLQDRIKTLEHLLVQSDKMRSIGQLSGAIAHDFNNLLTIMMCHIEIAKKNISNPEKMSNFIEGITESTDRARDLTTQLLTFCRSEVESAGNFDLNCLCSQSEQLIRRLMGENIHFTMELSPNPLLINISKGHFSQIIINLCVNARDAMPEGGQLSLKTYATSEKSAGLNISDTGIGIDESIQNRIYEPLFTTKDPGKGTGLGLSTVHELVEKNRGKISFSSTVGHGTTFELAFPLAEPDTSQIAKSKLVAIQAAAPGSETILLVEDEQMVCQVIYEMLSKHGYNVISAESPTQALKLCEASEIKPDLILTDIVMPGMRGTELAALLKKKMPEMKIMYMSGYTDHAVTPKILEEEKSTFIGKPFTPHELLEKLEAALQ